MKNRKTNRNINLSNDGYGNGTKHNDRYDRCSVCFYDTMQTFFLIQQREKKENKNMIDTITF